MQQRNLKYMKSTLVFALSLVAICANAELFKWKDAEGNLIYSDQPPPGKDQQVSEIPEESLPQIITVPAPDLTKSSTLSTSSKSQTKKEIYHDLAIIEPVNDTSVRENSGKVKISVRVDPYIFNERGHQLVIYMDGAEVSRGPQTSVVLDNVDRGTHTIKASIINGQGHILRETRVTTFTLHRYHT
jgi:hypothetical protein